METFNVYLLQRNVKGWNQELVQYKMEDLINWFFNCSQSQVDLIDWVLTVLILFITLCASIYWPSEKKI